MTVLVIIPARGGSKGIPRKNLRLLSGKPLISYTIMAALGADIDADVFVSTDDDEIAVVSERYGASVVQRSGKNADDQATVDDVIFEAVQVIESKTGLQYSTIVTIQPTSPLLKSETIESAVEKFKSGSSTDTLLSVISDKHLRWHSSESEPPRPLYAKRVNRQQLPNEFKETGAIVVCSREQIRERTRIGTNVKLLELPKDQAVDIDDFGDFALCQFLLNRKKLMFVVEGHNEIGLGHAYRCLTLANALPLFEISFLFANRSKLAFEYIKSFNYRCSIVDELDLLEEITLKQPDIVINDILDSQVEYMKPLSELDLITVNFEDLGAGASYADAVINDLYTTSNNKNSLVGPEYFCLRTEFNDLAAKSVPPEIKEVLICFGGTDPANLTERVLELLLRSPHAKDFQITVVTGPGYTFTTHLLDRFGENPKVAIVTETKRISDFMHRADLAFTSNGRTILELASMNTLAISISQNTRETTHAFSCEENGIRNLGLHEDVSDKTILKNLEAFCSDEQTRVEMFKRLSRFDVGRGTERVVEVINSFANKGVNR